MKKLFLSVFLPILFLILSGFSQPQELAKPDSIPDTKEVEFKMTFEPARIIVNDKRDISYATLAYEALTTSNNNMATILNEIANYLPYIIENQERRWMSDIDYLSQRTNWSENRINTAFNNHKKYNLIKGLSLLILAGGVLSFLTFTRGELINWNHLLYKTMGAIILASAIYYAWLHCLATLPFMSDYVYLINLTSFT